MRLRACACLAAMGIVGNVGIATVAAAQAPNPLVGAWERVSVRRADGRSTQPPPPKAFVVFTDDGWFSQSSIPLDRPKLGKPLEEMTREELLLRFNHLEARWGRYTISGDRLTRTPIGNSAPERQGIDQVQQFRFDDGDLLLIAVEQGTAIESRFRRAK